nr:RHS repeat-associated core domain-containing protein [Hafnia paralvei]
MRFSGQYADEESGLYYNRHRYYDGDTGLYLSPDPIGLGGGVNPYSYVKNPLKWVDPLGLCPKTGEDTKGFVYLRTNPETGEMYVGQAKSKTRFLARQGEHDSSLGVEHAYKILGTAKPGTALDVLE